MCVTHREVSQREGLNGTRVRPTWSEVGDLHRSSLLVSLSRLGERGTRWYGSAEPYRSSVIMLSTHTLCSMSTTTMLHSVPYATLKHAIDSPR
jgi:hypothetical protein